MNASVRGVFEPNPTPPDYIGRTRLPLVLRPRHFKANAEDVVDIEAYVAALSPRYGAIRAPTAIVTGDSDGVVYARIHSAGCARDIPGATLTMLAGVGHSPHHSAPESVVAAIVEVDARARRTLRPRRRPGRPRRCADCSWRSRRAEGNAGDDDHAFADAGEAIDIGVAAGAVGHVAFVARVLGDDGVDAPGERETARRRDDGGQGEDRRGRPLARDAQSRRARSGPGADDLRLQRLRDVARRLGDRVGAGRLRRGALGRR